MLLEKHYETSDEQLQTILREMEGIGDDIEVVREEEDEGAALQAAVDDAPVVKLINGILTDAVQRGASTSTSSPSSTRSGSVTGLTVRCSRS